MGTMTRDQAIAQGFTIDDGQRPLAYKGPRFNPTEKADVPTEREETLLARIERLREALRSLAHEDTELVSIAATALQDDDREAAR